MLILLTLQACSSDDSSPIRYILQINEVVDGTTTTNLQEPSFVQGTEVTLTAEPNSDFIFLRWDIIGNNSETDNPLNLVMDGNKFITPVFSGLRVSSISVLPPSLQLEIGDTAILTTSIEPSTAIDQSFSWAVDNPNIASIDSEGNVTGISEGTAIVTATTSDGAFTDTSQITVLAALPTNSFLIDFGPDDGTNGNITMSPDLNGNHWNNIVDPSATSAISNIIDYTGSSTGYNLTVSSDMSANGILNGGLLAPDPALLGEFAINTVTQDYFFNFNSTSRLTISGLETNTAYSFNIFGSRNTTSTRISQYTISGLTQYGINTTLIGTNQSSGAGIGLGTSSPNGNDSIVYASELIFPNALGEITIDITAITGGFAYINLMRIFEYGN